MQTFSLCLYGTSGRGFTYLLARESKGAAGLVSTDIVETDGPGSQCGDDQGDPVGSMTACVWHALRHVRDECKARVAIFLPTGDVLWAGTVGDALRLSVGDMLAANQKAAPGDVVGYTLKIGGGS